MDAQTLLSKDLWTVQQWLDNAEESPTGVPPDFNWHGFAFGAAANARNAPSRDDADTWATLALRVYERLASAGEEAESCELSAMHLRAWMICHHGGSDDNAVRDPRTLIDWFRRRNTASLGDTERDASELRSIPLDRWSEHLDRLRRLRALKNRINVFRTLDDAPAELRPWLRLWPLLP